MRFDAFRQRSTPGSGSGGSWSGPMFTARQASDLGQFWGVAVHLTYPTYNTRKDAICQLIADAGITWVRDGWNPSNSHGATAAASIVSHDLGMMAVNDPRDTTAETQAGANALANNYSSQLGTSLIGVEGWNEPDVPATGGSLATDASVAARVLAWQQYVWNAYKAIPAYASTLPIAGPSLAYSHNTANWDAIDVTAYADRATLHDYAGGSYTETDPTYDLYRSNAALMVTTGRVITTETGNSTGQTGAPGYNVPDEAAAGITTPRVQWEHFRRGWEMSSTYEFLDQGTDGAFENSFGLVHYDLTPKPAYTTIKNTLTLLADPGTAFTPTALPMNFSGDGTTTRFVLLQKRTGQWWLAVWEQVPVWTSGGTRAASVSRPITLTFDRSRTVTVYDPHTSQTATSTTTGTSAVVNSTEKTTLIRIV